jgi:hypothetical protein
MKKYQSRQPVSENNHPRSLSVLMRFASMEYQSARKSLLLFQQLNVQHIPSLHIYNASGEKVYEMNHLYQFSQFTKKVRQIMRNRHTNEHRMIRLQPPKQEQQQQQQEHSENYGDKETARSIHSNNVPVPSPTASTQLMDQDWLTSRMVEMEKDTTFPLSYLASSSTSSRLIQESLQTYVSQQTTLAAIRASYRSRSFS